MSGLARQSSPESENTRARPFIDASLFWPASSDAPSEEAAAGASPLFLESSEVVADLHEDELEDEELQQTRSPRESSMDLAGAGYDDDERTRSPRESYHELASLASLEGVRGAGYEDEPTRSPRQSYLDLAAAAPIAPPSSRARPSRGSETPRANESETPRANEKRPSFVALSELPQLPGVSQRISRPSFAMLVSDRGSSSSLSAEPVDAPVLSRRRPSFESSETSAVPSPPASRVRASSHIAAAEIAPPYEHVAAPAPESETGFLVAAPSSRPARASFVASGEIDRDHDQDHDADRAHAHAYDHESVTNYAVSPRASYVAPKEIDGSYAVVESDDGSYATSEIEQVASENTSAYDNANAQQSAPLDYDALKRFLFDDAPAPQQETPPSPAPYEPSYDSQYTPALAQPYAQHATAYDQPQQPIHDGTIRLSDRHLRAPPPVHPMATIRPSSFALQPARNVNVNVNVNGVAPQPQPPASTSRRPSFAALPETGETPVLQEPLVAPTSARRPLYNAGPSGETPVQPIQQAVASHFAHHQLAQPRLPSMPERSQLGRTIDAVRMHLAQSMAARTELVQSNPTPGGSTVRRYGAQDRYRNFASAPPSGDVSVDSPWIVPTSPTPRSRLTPLAPPPPFKVTFALIAAAMIALLAVGIVVAALVFVHSPEDKRATSTAAATTTTTTTPVAATDNPPPPPVATTMVVIAPPPVAPPVTPPVATIAAPADPKPAAATTTAKGTAKASSEGSASAFSPNARSDKTTDKSTDKGSSSSRATAPAAATPTTPTPRPKATAAASAPKTNSNKSVEQMLDELGEEQLRR